VKRIICVGNRYIFEDAAGPKVYDHLRQQPLPDDVEVIDGGLAGLDLLRFMEGAERVVLVDGVSGFSQSDAGEQNAGSQIVVLEVADVAAAAGSRYEHSAGLVYLLRILPEVCEGAVPQTLLVGIEGQPDEGVVDEAATLAVQIAVGENPGNSKRRSSGNTPSGGAE
jgi:hydrogenase maturation protease